MAGMGLGWQSWLDTYKFSWALVLGPSFSWVLGGGVGAFIFWAIVLVSLLVVLFLFFFLVLVVLPSCCAVFLLFLGSCPGPLFFLFFWGVAFAGLLFWLLFSSCFSFLFLLCCLLVVVFCFGCCSLLVLLSCFCCVVFLLLFLVLQISN